jgi:hypothetical protein
VRLKAQKFWEYLHKMYFKGKNHPVTFSQKIARKIDQSMNKPSMADFTCDDEKTNQVSHEDTQLPFGKFKGRTVGDLAGESYETRGYLRFLLTKQNLYETLREAISVTLDRSSTIHLSFGEAKAVTLRFGQHRGSTVGQIARTGTGRDYLFSYLLSWDKLGDELREAIGVVHEAYKQVRAANP